MAGARRAGPEGVGDQSLLGTPPSVTPWSGLDEPDTIGVGDFTHLGRAAMPGGEGTSAAGVGRFAQAGQEHRVVPAGVASGKAGDEEVLPPDVAVEVLTRLFQDGGATAALGPGVLPQVRNAELVVLRTRPPEMRELALPLELPAPPPPPPAKAPKPQKDGWIEIEVTTDAGDSRAGDTYKLELADGKVVTGTIGGDGVISLNGIEPGNAQLTITSLDGKAWY